MLAVGNTPACVVLHLPSAKQCQQVGRSNFQLANLVLAANPKGIQTASCLIYVGSTYA